MNDRKNMLDRSCFYHFGILPQACIHSLIEDEYSKMYEPEKNCKCGCENWYEDDAVLFIGLPPKKVHRCKRCNELRMGIHIGMKQAHEIMSNLNQGEK